MAFALQTVTKRADADAEANREAQPEDLSAQIPLVRELVEAFRIPILEVEDFEADDVIATHRGHRGIGRDHAGKRVMATVSQQTDAFPENGRATADVHDKVHTMRPKN